MTAANGLPRLTAARHAACAHFAVRGARPDVKWAKLQAHTVSTGCAKSHLSTQSLQNREFCGRRSRPAMLRRGPPRGPRLLRGV